MLQEPNNATSSLSDETKKISNVVEDMNADYLSILEIFLKIQDAPAEKRIKYIDKSKQYMKEIQQKTRENDEAIEKSTKRI